MHVVILAYGPTRVTKSAIRRARALTRGSGRLIVVAASDLGVGTIDDTRAETVDQIGTAGVADALGRLGFEPALLIHDDVLLTPRNARRLAQTWEETRTLAVPYTNDVGCDHFAGTLPPTGQAAERLDSLAGKMTERLAYRVCTTAMYGPASALSSFTRLKMADPRTTIHDPANPFMASPAIASHDGSCRDRLVPDRLERPVLVASMIVKNEEDTLGDCLASLEGLVDRIEILDTGSTDATIEIAESFGANVRRTEWRNDFGAARTMALETCRDAMFVLQIDADERAVCEDPTLLRRVLATYHREHEGLKVRIRNLGGLSESPTSTFRAIRLFQAPDTMFSGAIHEYAIHESGRMLVSTNLDLLQIDHIGYSAAFIAERNKGQRNLDIARAQYEDHQNFRTLFDYARSVRLADPTDPLSKSLFQETLDVIEGGNPQAQAYVYGTVAIDKFKDGEIDAAIDLARKGLDLVPADPLCAVGFARAASTIGEFTPIVDLAVWRASSESPDPLYVIDENEFSFLNELVRAFIQLDRLGEAFGVAGEVVAESPQSFTAWPELLKGLAALEIDHAEVIAPLVVLDSTGRWSAAAAATFPAATTAEACALYLERGGSHPSVVSTGILAAMVSGEIELTARFDPFVGLLDPETARKLAERATARGVGRVAAMVMAAS